MLTGNLGHSVSEFRVTEAMSRVVALALFSARELGLSISFVGRAAKLNSARASVYPSPKP